MESTSNNVRIDKVIIFIFLILFFAITLFSCNTDEKKKTETTTSSGTLKIMADDTFKPLLGTSAETFEAINPNAKITLEYLPQEQAITNLLKGQTDVVIAGRSLTKDEEVIIRNKGLILKVNQIAYDGLIFIRSKENKDTVISEDKITAILSGKDKTRIVCDKSNSANIVYLKKRYNLSNEVKNVGAAGSDSAVIEYVTNHPESIGIIGMALVSDQEDPMVQKRLSGINLLLIQYKDSTGKPVIGRPTLEDLGMEKYPFIRDIFIINLDGSTKLGTGFANFIVGEKGQRIILKAGLLPFAIPGREIILNN